MKDLIEALTILQKYLKEDNHNPTHCSAKQLTIMDVEPSKVSPEDLARLDELGFFPSGDEEDSYFLSFRFGRA